MRVGIPLPMMPETSGGGYIFEQDLLRGLLQRVEQSRHDFVFIGRERDCPATLPRNCSFLSAGWEKSLLRRVHDRGARLANKLVKGTLSFLEFSTGAPQPSWTDRVLDENRIQFLLSLNCFTLSQEIPYLTFVWDIEHRVQPYFPELSADGEWEAREARYRNTLRRAAVVVTGTSVGKEQIQRFYQVAPERISILRHPTPDDARTHVRATDDAILARYGLSKPFLLYPAQFWPHKNHVRLLQALRLLDGDDEWRPFLVFVGSDQGNRSYVERKARELGVESRVKFLGFVPRADLLELYCQACVLVYPSTFGPENLPPLEAFALRCPVVASDVPGALEQLGDAALRVNADDAREMANGIRRVSTDACLRERMIEAGVRRSAAWTNLDLADGVLALVDRFEGTRELWQ